MASGLFASTRHGKQRCDEDDCDHRGGKAAIEIVGEGDDDDRRGKEGPSSVVKKLGRKKSNEPCYWHDEDDPFVIVTSENLVYGRGGYEYALGVEEDERQHQQHQQQQQQQRQQRHDVREDLQIPNVDTNVKLINDGGNHHRKRIKFTIRVNPRVLIRHRTARGFVYNPSRAAQETFRDRLLELLPSTFRPILTDDYYNDDDGDEIRGVGGSSSSSSSSSSPSSTPPSYSRRTNP